MCDFPMNPVCPVCGSPANMAALDSREVPTSGMIATFIPGPVRYGCSKHPPKRPRSLRLDDRMNDDLTEDDIREIVLLIPVTEVQNG